MYRISRLIVWLTRVRHCRGFGVQSPTDYSFIRYVVNEHYPYYAYSDLAEQMPHTDRTTRKLCRLYFRMANFLQPDTVVCTHITPSRDTTNGKPGGDNARTETEARARYIKAGCRKAQIMSNPDDAERIGLLIVTTADDGYEQTVRQALAKTTPRSVFVIEGIGRDRRARDLWRRLTADDRVGVTFDLYYAGIAFFDRQRYKQSYKVNF